jgi:hypothetical protein
MNSGTGCDERPTPAREWQISLKGILWATYWIAVCIVAWRARHPWRGPGEPGYWFYFATMSFRFVPIPTAIGALFGHPWRGAAVGIALYAGFSLLIRILIYLLAGTRFGNWSL